MKWIGFFLVLIGSGGIGFSLVLEYTGRLRELTAVRQMIHYIVDAILYDGLPLAEAFFRCSMRIEGEYGAFLEKTAQQLETFCGEDPAWLWKSNAAMLSDRLKKKDWEKFADCMAQTGFSDPGGQVQVLRLYEEELSDQIIKLEKQKEEKCKLYQTIGIMAGVFICILLF